MVFDLPVNQSVKIRLIRQIRERTDLRIARESRRRVTLLLLLEQVLWAGLWRCLWD